MTVQLKLLQPLKVRWQNCWGSQSSKIGSKSSNRSRQPRLAQSLPTAATAITAVATPALEAPEVKTKEVQIKELCDEWKGTIRSLWSRSIQIFPMPDGSWKLAHDLLKNTVAFKTPRVLLSGDSRRSPSPQHLLVWLNPNLQDATTVIDMARLTEPFKDSDGKLLEGRGNFGS